LCLPCVAIGLDVAETGFGAVGALRKNGLSWLFDEAERVSRAAGKTPWLRPYCLPLILILQLRLRNENTRSVQELVQLHLNVVKEENDYVSAANDSG
jgi:hypothetical protein